MSSKASTSILLEYRGPEPSSLRRPSRSEKCSLHVLMVVREVGCVHPETRSKTLLIESPRCPRAIITISKAESPRPIQESGAGFVGIFNIGGKILPLLDSQGGAVARAYAAGFFRIGHDKSRNSPAAYPKVGIHRPIAAIVEAFMPGKTIVGNLIALIAKAAEEFFRFLPLVESAVLVSGKEFALVEALFDARPFLHDEIVDGNMPKPRREEFHDSGRETV